MSNLPADMYEPPDILRQSYAARLQAQLEQLAATWKTLHDGPWNVETAAALQQIAQSLAGTSAALDLTGMSVAAQQLAQEIAQSGHPPAVAAPARIGELVEIVCRVGDPTYLSTLASPRLAGGGGPALAEAPHDQLLFWPGHNLAAPAAAPRQRPSIFLVEDDTSEAADLAAQIGHFGYQVRIIGQLADLGAAAEHAEPAAIVISLAVLNSEPASASTIAALQRAVSRPIPLIFVSALDDFDARLRAVQAGGHAFLTRPLNAVHLVDTLDRFASPEAPDPYRVLIVSEDSELAGIHSLYLTRAGLLAATVADYREVMSALAALRPDLILMDVHMRGCSGLDLAAVIRQQDTYVGMPIVFLAPEANADRQLAALQLGGDDFLARPIQPEHLVATITARAQRARKLRTFMMRDSLTGLLNHTSIEERLEIELARAERYHTPLAVALLDLDHFKDVNDTYGHTVGDQVLKSLARLLQQRLRRTDGIGRFGGEEFMIILPSTNSETAAHVMETIRDSFSQIRQRADCGNFTVSLSCGVAAYPNYSDAVDLVRAADAALYDAKREGRNQVRQAICMPYPRNRR